MDGNFSFERKGRVEAYQRGRGVVIRYEMHMLKLRGLNV